MFTIDVKLNGVWLFLGDVRGKEEFVRKLDVTNTLSDYVLDEITDEWSEFTSRGFHYRVKKI